MTFDCHHGLAHTRRLGQKRTSRFVWKRSAPAPANPAGLRRPDIGIATGANRSRGARYPEIPRSCRPSRLQVHARRRGKLRRATHTRVIAKEAPHILFAEVAAGARRESCVFQVCVAIDDDGGMASLGSALSGQDFDRAVPAPSTPGRLRNGDSPLRRL